MGKRQFQLSDTEIGQLRQQEQQTRRAAELKRLQAVRLYGSGVAIAQIMDITGCAESSIRAWTQAYKREGVAALQFHYDRSAQNASRLTEAQRSIDATRRRLPADDLSHPASSTSSSKFCKVVNIRLFGMAGVMLDSADIAHLVQTFFEAVFHVLAARNRLSARKGI